MNELLFTSAPELHDVIQHKGIVPRNLSFLLLFIFSLLPQYFACALDDVRRPRKDPHPSITTGHRSFQIATLRRFLQPYCQLNFTKSYPGPATRIIAWRKLSQFSKLRCTRIPEPSLHTSNSHSYPRDRREPTIEIASARDRIETTEPEDQKRSQDGPGQPVSHPPTSKVRSNPTNNPSSSLEGRLLFAVPKSELLTISLRDVTVTLTPPSQRAASNKQPSTSSPAPTSNFGAKHASISPSSRI